jgi:cysteinyl-tRNA synthetase
MQVINITDVGHLTSDADEGDDKMTVALKREGLPLTLESMHSIGDTYAASFLEDLTALNIRPPSALPRASEHIDADIALIETLVQKEYAYQTGDGVYFDTSRFKDYGKLGNIDLDAQETGERVTHSEEKRHPSDFALWKRNDTLGWDSPWGKGFPGWHIECSAMAMQYLGKELNIHTGGVDHIGTHHNNEIAQSEAATGKPFVRYWMHNAHVLVEGTKFSKSLGNTIKLRQLKEHGYHPLAYRYWLLTGHYRTPLNFSFTALKGAETALRRLQRYFVEELRVKAGTRDETHTQAFMNALNNDLDTPKAIAVLWDLIKDESVSKPDKRSTLLYFDRGLGLGLNELATSGKDCLNVDVRNAEVEDVPEHIESLVAKRNEARAEKNWTRADELRSALENEGYEVLDTDAGTTLKKQSR